MRTIWRFNISTGRTVFGLPKDAKFLHFQAKPDREALSVWFEVDDSQDNVTWEFYVYGTGHRIFEGDTYLATACVSDYVWHLYRKPA